jgi:transketolase
MPCWELFETHARTLIRAKVLGTAPRIGVEAAVSTGLAIAGLAKMGALSACAALARARPRPSLYNYFGITLKAVTTAAIALIK